MNALVERLRYSHGNKEYIQTGEIPGAGLVASVLKIEEGNPLDDALAAHLECGMEGK